MPPQNNPYEFMNGGQPAAGGTNPLNNILKSGNSVQKRMIIVAVGVVLLIIVFLIVSSFISSSNQGSVTDMADVAQEQSVMSSMSQTANSMATTQLVKDLAVNTYLTMLSAQSQFLSGVKATGIKLSTAQTTKTNSQITSALTAASTTGTYDATFVQIDQNQLGLYVTDLANAYKATPYKTLKATLTTLDKQAVLLQSEATAAGNNLS